MVLLSSLLHFPELLKREKRRKMLNNHHNKPMQRALIAPGPRFSSSAMLSWVMGYFSSSLRAELIWELRGTAMDLQFEIEPKRVLNQNKIQLIN